MGKKEPKKAEREIEHLKELKESFLALCGIDSSALQSLERAELVSALRAFQKTDENDYEDIETAACRLRTSLDSFLGYLDLERDEVSAIFRELHAHELLSPRGKLTLLCIHTYYKEQASSEDNMVEEIIGYLDRLYSIPRDNLKLKFWTTRFAKRRIILDVPWLKFLDHEDIYFPMSHGIVDEDKSADSLQDQTMFADDIICRSSPPAQEILKAVDTFLDESPLKCATYFLLVGASGSGKTYLCDQIEFNAAKNAAVRLIRPRIPIDFMGSRVGDAESIMLSIFSEIKVFPGKTILLVDDLDNLIQTDDDTDYSSIGYRLKLTLVSCLDQHRATDCFIVCTSSVSLDDKLQRFDRTFVIDPPNLEQRMAMIRTSLCLEDVSEEGGEIECILESLGKCTLGRSRAEIAKYYRQAMLATNTSHTTVGGETLTGKLNALQAMNDTVTQLTPASLRSGFIDGYVDMCVKSSAELLAGGYINEPPLPLIGEGMVKAWHQLESIIVTQLCRAGALERILNCDNQEHSRLFCGGVLLTGCPGSGKTTLAYHAARVAAFLLPSVKLVDVSCTSLVHKEVGGSEKALRRLFISIRAAAPCIVLLEGIENIASPRGHDTTTHGTMDRILSTLLIELDGIDSTMSGSKEEPSKFALIGITHKAAWIDPALRRPGRLDKTIELQKPGWEAREAIARQALKQQSNDTSGAINDISAIASQIAEETDNKTGADVIALCEEVKFKKLKDELSCF